MFSKVLKPFGILKSETLTMCLSAVLLVLPLSGCELSQNYLKADRSGNMDIQDYRDALASRLPQPEKVQPAADGVPDLQPYVANSAADIKAMPLVSVSVNQNVPVRDVLYELAQQAEYDIELDPNIRGSIIFTARNKPLDVVVERISEIAGLRYKFKEDKLRVEIDTPYHKTYKINYLSFVRENKSSINNDIAVVSGEGADTGSKFEAASKSEADFWGELETNLTQLLGKGSDTSSLKTVSDPMVQRGASVPPLLGEEAAPDAPQIQTVAQQPVQKTGEPRFSLNKQGGIISIYGTQREQERVASYLQVLKRSVTSQVLIEAKILEVSLTDEFSAGIDWDTIGLLGGEGFIGFDTTGAGFVRGVLNPATNPTTNFSVDFIGNDFTAMVDMISRFGTVKALASPRLTVLNNQSAVLNVAQNQVYFEIDIEVTTDQNTTQTSVDSTIRNVPEGVLINVQPSIDLEAKKISMAVRPTVTRITRFVNDPAVAFASAGLLTPIISQVPVVNVQEFDSVLQMNNGQAVVMGGLIQDRTDSEQKSVPILGEIPLAGALFRSQSDRITKTELVILIKATIVEGGNAVHSTDKDLYRSFSQDRRPFEL